MVALYYPEAWPTQISALYAWVRDGVSPTVSILKEQNAPRPAKPYVAIGVVTPPVSVGQMSEANTRGVRVLLLVDATNYSITIGGTAYSYVSGSPATMAAVRDGLIAAVNAALPDTATAVNTDVIDLALDADTVLAVGDPALLGVKLLQSYVGSGEMTVGIDGYSDVQDELVPIIDGLKLSTETSSVREALALGGLAVIQPVGSRRLNLVVNGLWERRYGFDLRVRTLTRRVEVIDLIESISAEGVQGTLSA